ncbi:hypothetical protein RHECNPAF_730043 [Rhizobium etli CNPAF512]|nr:hypothetical protein RHECNPAF_730043 [Rhizobium etli CNPAF512]
MHRPITLRRPKIAFCALPPVKSTAGDRRPSRAVCGRETTAPQAIVARGTGVMIPSRRSCAPSRSSSTRRRNPASSQNCRRPCRPPARRRPA